METMNNKSNPYNAPNPDDFLEDEPTEQLPEVKRSDETRKIDRIKETLEPFIISTSKNYPPPEPFITIGENYIATREGITTVSGKPKSGKTAEIDVMLAGAIREEETDYDGFPPMKVKPNPKRKAVIHIDTEQEKSSHSQSHKNGILGRIGADKEPGFFKSLNFREIPKRDRLKIFKEALMAYDYLFKGIHLIVVDGIADFIKSPNDEEESIKIVEEFSALASKYNCPIIVVLHTNPNGEKERGHIGSEIQRKSYAILTVKKDEYGISSIEGKDFRNGDPCSMPIIQFEYDTFKRRHIYAGVKNPTKDNDETASKLRKITQSVFSNIPKQSKDAVSEIQDLTGKSERTAKTYLDKMMNEYNFIKIDETYSADKREKYYVSLLQ